MNHLTLYTFQCPVCGSPGEADSTCEHLPPQADGYKGTDRVERKPVRVPGVGEERKLGDGLTALHEYLRLWGPDKSHAGFGAACGEDACILCLAESTVKELLDHFTQQPAGVGADADGDQHGEVGGVRVRASLVSADSDGNQQPQGGARLPAVTFDPWQGGDADAGSTPVRETRRHVAEGGSVQCGGVALAQKLQKLVTLLRERSQLADDEAEHERNRFEVRCAERGASRAYERAADELLALLDLTQQSSGGQEAEDDRFRLREIASLIEVNFNRDDALRDARFLRQVADRFPHSGGQEGGVEEGADRRG